MKHEQKGMTMKNKLLVCAAVAAVGMVANAGVLYWQVNDSPTSLADVNNNPAADNVTAAFNGWQYATLVHYNSELASGNGAASQANPPATTVDGRTVLSSTNPSGVSNTIWTKGDESPYGASIDSYSSGVFYIELVSSAGNIVGRSQALTYSAAKDLAQFETLSEAQMAMKVWNGGNTYTAVPEPTSGLLMLLGMAGLALRRRKVA